MTDNHWKQGKLYGKCRKSSAQGAVYDGAFRYNTFEGEGHLRTPDHEYKGAFARGARHGQGELRTRTPGGSAMEFKGIFKNNAFSRGTIIAEGGRAFEVDIDAGTVLEVLEGGLKQSLDQLPPDITI